MKRFEPGGFAPALAPLSGLYGLGVRVRESLFRSGLRRSHRLPVPVICIGNITTGGTGKTPLAAAIAGHLRDRGRHVVILSRGYGRVSKEQPLVVSEGSGPLVGADAGGDEPVLLARRLTGVPIVVGADRRRCGQFAIERLGAEVLLLDDGFQHRRLARDLDIVVLDCLDPFGGYHLLPAGRLREPIAALARAGLFVVTRSAPGDGLLTLTGVVRAHNPGAPIVRAGTLVEGFVPGNDPGAAPATLDTLRKERIAAFCAIGNPEAFRLDLIRLGLTPIRFESFRDHHRYTQKELRTLDAEARRAGAAALVTTEKDATRLPPAGDRALPVLALRIRLTFDPEAAFFAAIDEAARVTQPQGAAP